MNYRNPEYYFNREISWLRFNERVLEEAEAAANPFFERVKFLSIASSNLDEFFMVRIASLKDLKRASYKKKDASGLTSTQQLELLSRQIHLFYKREYDLYNTVINPGLNRLGLIIPNRLSLLDFETLKRLDDYFTEQVFPVLTPIAVNGEEPFPLIKNMSLNIAVKLSKGLPATGKYMTLELPQIIPRLFMLKNDSGLLLVPLELIIKRNLEKIFPGFSVEGSCLYRIMRNADFDIDDEDTEDLLKEIEDRLKTREQGDIIRLEIEQDGDRELKKMLTEAFDIKGADIYKPDGPLDLTLLMKLYDLPGLEKYKKMPLLPFVPRVFKNSANIFETIRKGDILLHHPYDSFDPVISFVQEAAGDERVISIKQTLYRVSGSSPIVRALIEAAKNKKQVTVMVELKARFDEQKNIDWARKLEGAGCHVIYGLAGLKIHSKLILIERKEENSLVRYVHLGTGNYNDQTARMYTDFGLFTCDEKIGEDSANVFNMLSSRLEPLKWNRLVLAPHYLKERLLFLIDRERQNALKGRPALIMGKMNSLSDPDIIEALYLASASGVTIKLLVRGICCLRPGVVGVSENIFVYSIVGDYLEHGREFYFENAGNYEIYMSSADWMPRNLNRRVEIMFPLENENIKQRALEILKAQFADNVKTRVLLTDGTYIRKEKCGAAINCQQLFTENRK